jgi:hypothetical protein
MSGNWIDATSTNLRQKHSKSRQRLSVQELNCRSGGNRCLHAWPTIRGGSGVNGSAPVAPAACSGRMLRVAMPPVDGSTSTDH